MTEYLSSSAFPRIWKSLIKLVHIRCLDLTNRCFIWIILRDLKRRNYPVLHKTKGKGQRNVWKLTDLSCDPLKSLTPRLRITHAQGTLLCCENGCWSNKVNRFDSWTKNVQKEWYSPLSVTGAVTPLRHREAATAFKPSQQRVYTVYGVV